MTWSLSTSGLQTARFNPRNWLLGSLLAGGVALAPAQAEITLPDLGGGASSALSRQAEQQLGEQSMQQLRRSGAILDDPELSAYLNDVGARLLKAAGLEPDEFEFFAVPAWDINAFALPGGYIGVNLGLIEATQSESELASVLAHEISHVTQRHLARQMEAQKNQGATTLAGVVAAIAAAAAGNGELASAALSTTIAGQMQSQINYTRENEHEADRIGFTMLQGAGFDPAAMASFFKRLEAATNLGVDSEQYSYLMTHPLTRTRVAEAQDRAARSATVSPPESLDFALVNALVLSYHGAAETAAASLRAELQNATGIAAQATRYGLAAAQLRAKQYREAETTLQPLQSAGLHHPMVDSLAAFIALQLRDTSRAVRLYQTALSRYPDYAQLVYDYPRALIADKQHQAAADFIDDRLNSDFDAPNRAQLHQIAAEAWAALQQNSRSHMHLGEYYADLQNYPAAVEQFELAYDINDAGPLKRKVIKHRLDQVMAERSRMMRAGAPDNGTYATSFSR